MMRRTDRRRDDDEIRESKGTCTDLRRLRRLRRPAGGRPRRARRRRPAGGRRRRARRLATVPRPDRRPARAGAGGHGGPAGAGDRLEQVPGLGLLRHRRPGGRALHDVLGRHAGRGGRPEQQDRGPALAPPDRSHMAWSAGLPGRPHEHSRPARGAGVRPGSTRTALRAATGRRRSAVEGRPAASLPCRDAALRLRHLPAGGGRAGAGTGWRSAEPEHHGLPGEGRHTPVVDGLGWRLLPVPGAGHAGRRDPGGQRHRHPAARTLIKER